jgi:hypothetical protein
MRGETLGSPAVKAKRAAAALAGTDQPPKTATESGTHSGVP